MKGWNSQTRREFPGKFESSNLSRDYLSLSRENWAYIARGALLGVPAQDPRVGEPVLLSASRKLPGRCVYGFRLIIQRLFRVSVLRCCMVSVVEGNVVVYGSVVCCIGVSMMPQHRLCLSDGNHTFVNNKQNKKTPPGRFREEPSRPPSSPRCCYMSFVVLVLSVLALISLTPTEPLSIVSPILFRKRWWSWATFSAFGESRSWHHSAV